MMETGFSILAILAPFVVLFSYRKGLSDGKTIEKGEPLGPIVPKVRKKARENREEQKLRAILCNIDSYNGSARGQREVE